MLYINKLFRFRWRLCFNASKRGSSKKEIIKKNKTKKEDPLRSYSLVSAMVCLFVLIIVLKFVGNE